MESKPLTVLIADDHGVVREGLRVLLEREGIQVVGEAATGGEAVALARQLRPTVVLLDIRMPGGDGLQALSAIKTTLPQTSVIILSTYADPSYVSKAVAKGAAGYLSKEVDPERIPEAVRAVARGDNLLNRELLRIALAHTAAQGANEPQAVLLDPLSEREWDVLRLIVAGLNNEAIAETLTISIATVKTHVCHILDKLGVSDRTQAAVWAVRYGVA